MASASLHSASAYLNNLLLARGLLQDGKAIQFDDPAQNGETDRTMSRIINLVHELVLRRDRDAEQRENLTGVIRSLRVDEAQRVLDLQRVQDKNTDLGRDLNAAQAQERTAKAALRRAEAEVKSTREQVAKLKSTLDQVRAKCISDVRKRDNELEKLKSHLGSMQRGKKEGSGMKINTMRPSNLNHTTSDHRTHETTNSEWSLEKETNDFLAAIVNETSAENVALRNIVMETVTTLKSLTGFEEVEHGDNDPALDGIGIPGQNRRPRQASEGSEAIIPCEVLASQMSNILLRCQSILKDPSFVPIEEVQIREDEIVKLRIGWEKMANRWKEAVTMMDSWRKRMTDGNEPFDMEELSNLEFGKSVAMMPNGEPVLGQDEELLSFLFDHSKMSNSEQRQDLDRVDEVEPETEDESDLDIPPEPSPKRLAASPARRGIRLPRPVQPLREHNANARHLQTHVNPLQDSLSDGEHTLSSDGEGPNENDTFRHISRSKIPRQTARKKSPQMTVEEKLAAVEAEAKAAAEARQQEPTHKRKARQKTESRSRRRSTLSPEELAALMGAR